MVTASAIATFEELWPGRLWAYFGTGFTARTTMGKRSVKWSDLATYIGQLRGLLRGDIVEIEGEACRLMYSPGFGPDRPIDVPIGLAPMGPKGMAVSRELVDRVILTASAGAVGGHWPHCSLLTYGSVLDPAEDHTSHRLFDAAGPAYATNVHAMWEWTPDVVPTIPGGPEWLERIETEFPDGKRHLGVHEGHLVTVTDRDRPMVEAAGEAILGTSWTGTPTSVAARMDAVGAKGITEVVYGPAGPDIPRELTAFAAAARS
jgi:5,10-methylenetetrahydromethanopterin reductase